MENTFENEYSNYYRINSTTLEEICQEYTPGFSF